jgi:carboxylate-amine ligase
VIPESVFSRRTYFNTIYEKIKQDISPYDTAEILDPIWVNSRGAIPRFDRGSIEIRVMDIQECPSADLAIVTLVIETVKALVEGKFIPHDLQIRWKPEQLADILDKTAEKAQDASIDDREYLQVFGLNASSAKASEVWRHIVAQLIGGNAALLKWKPEIDVILTQGSLAQRIVNSTGTQPSRETIATVYRKLCACLEQNKMFLH